MSVTQSVRLAIVDIDRLRSYLRALGRMATYAAGHRDIGEVLAAVEILARDVPIALRKVKESV